MSDRVNQIRQRCAEVFENARKLYGVSLQNVQIRFDLRGRTAGMAGYNTVGGYRRYYLRFNVDMIANSSFNHIINDTVPHEIAHLVCYENPRFGDNHNAGWRRVCKQLGGTGERCHREEVSYANGLSYQYVTSNGRTVVLSQIRHNKIQKGVVYRFKYGWGHIDRNSKWQVVGKNSARISETSATSETANKTLSQVEQIQSAIKIAKSKNIDIDSVVMALSIHFGLSKTDARKHVEENWARA